MGSRIAPLAFAAVLLRCSHPMTADQHRLAAEQEARAANAELGSYDPTDSHFDAAVLHRRAARAHLEAAQQLERFEAAACGGVTPEVRRGCPLLSPRIARVEETATGVRLQLKPSVVDDSLVNAMRCHLAFAQAHGEDARECPLYLPGVTLVTPGPGLIELRTDSVATAAELRREARALFAPKRLELRAPVDQPLIETPQ